MRKQLESYKSNPGSTNTQPKLGSKKENINTQGIVNTSPSSNKYNMKHFLGADVTIPEEIFPAALKLMQLLEVTTLHLIEFYARLSISKLITKDAVSLPEHKEASICFWIEPDKFNMEKLKNWQFRQVYEGCYAVLDENRKIYLYISPKKPPGCVFTSKIAVLLEMNPNLQSLVPQGKIIAEDLELRNLHQRTLHTLYEIKAQIEKEPTLLLEFILTSLEGIKPSLNKITAAQSANISQEVLAKYLPQLLHMHAEGLRRYGRAYSLELAKFWQMHVFLRTEEATYRNMEAADHFYMGLSYVHGYGVEKNPITAFQYFSSANRAGNIPAKTELACLYIKGEGIYKDLQTGMQLMHEAALEGEPGALEFFHCYYHKVNKDESNNYSQKYQDISAKTEEQCAHQTLEVTSHSQTKTLLPDIERFFKNTTPSNPDVLESSKQSDVPRPPLVEQVFVEPEICTIALEVANLFGVNNIHLFGEIAHQQIMHGFTEKYKLPEQEIPFICFYIPQMPNNKTPNSRFIKPVGEGHYVLLNSKTTKKEVYIFIKPPRVDFFIDEIYLNFQRNNAQSRFSSRPKLHAPQSSWKDFVDRRIYLSAAMLEKAQNDPFIIMQMLLKKLNGYKLADKTNKKVQALTLSNHMLEQSLPDMQRLHIMILKIHGQKYLDALRDYPNLLNLLKEQDFHVVEIPPLSSLTQYDASEITIETFYTKENLYYFEKAIYEEETVADAWFHLGDCYLKGEDLEKNYSVAFHYFHSAASKNHPDAQKKLACMYFLGLGTTPDIDKGMFWLHLTGNEHSVLKAINWRAKQTTLSPDVYAYVKNILEDKPVEPAALMLMQESFFLKSVHIEQPSYITTVSMCLSNVCEALYLVGSTAENLYQGREKPMGRDLDYVLVNANIKELEALQFIKNPHLKIKIPRANVYSGKLHVKDHGEVPIDIICVEKLEDHIDNQIFTHVVYCNDGVINDFSGIGFAAISQNCISMIGDPNKHFQEDPTRLLRVIDGFLKGKSCSKEVSIAIQNWEPGANYSEHQAHINAVANRYMQERAKHFVQKLQDTKLLSKMFGVPSHRHWNQTIQAVQNKIAETAPKRVSDVSMFTKTTNPQPSAKQNIQTLEDQSNLRLEQRQ